MAELKDITVGIRIRMEAEIKAEALREAADLLYTDEGPKHPLSTASWLNERADKIDGGQS